MFERIARFTSVTISGKRSGVNSEGVAPLLIIVLLIILIFVTFSNQYKVIEWTGEVFNNINKARK